VHSQPVTIPGDHSVDGAGESYNAAITEADVVKVLGNLKNGKASGTDGIPVEFYKYAVIRDDKGKIIKFLLAPVLASIFDACFQQGVVPQEWGQALLTLIHKGGDDTDWARYRPIAVIQGICKLYATVLSDRLSDWAEANDVRRPSQAGFRPKFGTAFNAFVLQHLLNKSKRNRKPMHCCFVDLKKAYDSTPRQKLWDRLYQVGVKGKMLTAVASLYTDVQFSVKFANGLSPTFSGDTGVRQGCPLSPFLFGVFIEMLHDKISEAYPMGIGPCISSPRGQQARIPILMFADDIVLLGLNAQQLQQLLDVLRDFCTEHDMMVSDDKTKVVVFHKSFATRKDRDFSHTVGNMHVEYASEYKYLGMVFGNKGQPSRLMKDAATRGTKAKGVMYRMYKKLGITSNVYLKLRLYKAVMLPNLTYGCEVWGQQLLRLQPDKPFDNPVDKVSTSFLKNLLGVKSSTPTWCLYREVGMYPLQLYCFRQMIRFVNKLQLMPEHTWARMVMCEMAADARNAEVSNWLTDLIDFARKIGVHVRWPVPEDTDVDLPVFYEHHSVARLRHFYYNLFTDLEAPCKMKRYHRLFAKKVAKEGSKWSAAEYTYLPLAAKKANMLARCRLGSHHLKVETGTWQASAVPYEQRLCDLCDMGAVQNEYHIVFKCTHYNEQRDEHLAAHLENPDANSVWCLFNDSNAQSALADFLQSTCLMVH
jgi:hypothetical protein